MYTDSMLFDISFPPHDSVSLSHVAVFLAFLDRPFALSSAIDHHDLHAVPTFHPGCCPGRGP